MAWQIAFYSARVETEVLALPAGILARFVRYAERMETYGPDLGMPHTRSMGDGLFELRLKAAEGIGRVFYCTLVGSRIMMLHQFVKKSDKTPRKELAIARRRMKEVKDVEDSKQFKARALARPEVKKAYEDLADEFAFLDQVLRARSESGLTQAEVAERAGTTQSAIARLESAASSHSPSVATLQRYAQALGYRVEIRLVKERGLTPMRPRRVKRQSGVVRKTKSSASCCTVRHKRLV